MHNRIIGVIAPKGSGKTFEVCRFLRGRDRFVAFVIFRNDTGYLGVADQIVTENPRQLAEQMRGEKFKIIYHPGVPVIEGNDISIPFFDTFVKLCFSRGEMLMVCDEAHLLCTATQAPPWLLMALIDGRRRGLDIVYVSHRFATVHRMLTTNTDEYWFWKITEPADLQSIQERCGREVRDRVAALRRLEVVNGTVVPGEMLRWTAYGGIQEGQEPAPELEPETETTTPPNLDANVETP